MDHALELALIFGLDRKAVTAVAHGNYRILQHRTAGIENGVELSMDAVGRNFHLTADMAQPRAGVVGDLLLRKNTAGNFSIYVGERLQQAEAFIQRVVRKFRFGTTAVAFGAPGTGQEGAYS